MNPHDPGPLARLAGICGLLLVCSLPPGTATAQVAPTAAETSHYSGLHAAAHLGDLAGLQRLLAAGADLNARDARGRTPLQVATFARRPALRVRA